MNILKYLFYKNEAIEGLRRTLHVNAVCQPEGFALGLTDKEPAITFGQP